MDENKIADFDRELMKLAAKHCVSEGELKTLFSYKQEGTGMRYRIPDLPDSKFIKEAVALFDAHFR
ncbi:hypothetical protein BH09BAC6_BH09BAC6_33920 [soil metagenome]|jgi:hypothetical protein